jgi:hypothetical protein
MTAPVDLGVRRGRSRHVTTAAQLRLRVLASRGQADVVVPAGATPSALLEAIGLDPWATVRRSTGRSLDPELSLAQQGILDGDLLVVGAVHDPAPAPVGGETLPIVGFALPRAALLVPGALVLCGLGAGWAWAVEAWTRVVIALVALSVGVVVAVAPRIGRLPAGVQAAAPAFGAAAAVALLPRADGHDDVVAILVAGAVVAQVAIALRFFSTPEVLPALIVWAWAGTALTVLAALVLGGDGPPRAVWAGGAGLAVAAAALLPQFAIDAPEEQLLDTDRMAATTWSARSAAARVSRVRVRSRDVRAAVDTGRALVDAGAIAAATAAAGACIGVALDPIDGWPKWLSFATGMTVGVALAAISRSYGGFVPRVALRAGGLVAAAAGAGALLAEVNNVARAAIAGSAALVAVLVLLAAARLGQGWRSVWWARLGDGVGTLAVAASLPCAALAAGTFEHMRAFMS